MSQTLTIPAGYELDLENSTATNVVLKKVEKLPSTWADVKQIEGYYLLCGQPKHHMEWGTLLPIEEVVVDKHYHVPIGQIEMNTPVFATKEQAEAMQAIAKLTHLVKIYNGDWVHRPHYYSHRINYSTLKEDFEIISSRQEAILSFGIREKAELFLKNFKDLIIKAKPLIL